MTERISQFPNVDHFAFNEKSDQTVAEQYVEQIEGEVQMDAYVKAQTSAPQVVKRITKLENCIWRRCEINSSVPPDLRYSFLRRHVFVTCTHEPPNNTEPRFLTANSWFPCTSHPRLDLRFVWPQRGCGRSQSGRFNADNSRIRSRTP